MTQATKDAPTRRGRPGVRSTQKQRTLDEFRSILDDVILSIQGKYVQLGGILHDAKDELSGNELESLQTWLGKQGIKKTDQRAAMAAFLHENPDRGNESDQRIDPRLVFKGARNSKVLAIAPQDQRRLLSEERFETVSPHSGIKRSKCWTMMTEHEQNLLIGRGGRIRKAREQEDALDRKRRGNRRVYECGETEVTPHKMRMYSQDGLIEMSGDLRDLARRWGPEGIENINRAHRDNQSNGSVGNE